MHHVRGTELPEDGVQFNARQKIVHVRPRINAIRDIQFMHNWNIRDVLVLRF